MNRITLAGMLVCLSAAWVFAAEDASREQIYQVSSLSALLEGGYDGLISVSDLKSHGDFGIGTFEALDGELVMLKGTVYQVLGNGSVAKARAYTLVPYAAVTYFDADRTTTLAGISDIEGLEKALDLSFPQTNIPLAIKLHGVFSYVKTRAVPAQKKPYPRLSDVAAKQPFFERRDIAGTIVGFRLPSYFQGMAVPGYHFHFISDDKSFGGHLLNAAAVYCNVVVDDTPSFFLSLPVNKPFNELKLPAALPTEITAVEK